MQNKLVSDAAGYAPDRPGAFRFRIATARDLPHCVELLPPGCKLAPATRARLPEIWAGLLATEARVFPIIEDIERDHPENIGGFGLSVFVSDAFADELIATPRAYAPALFYDRLLAGDPVLLTRKDLHRVQLSGGINLFALHFGLHNHDLSDPRTVQILDTASASFYFFHAGYCIRTIMAEHYGGQAARYMERGGFRLVHDFRQTSALAGTPDDEMPAFFAQRREWIEPAAISGLAQLFAAKRARIHFSPGERRILERALLNEFRRGNRRRVRDLAQRGAQGVARHLRADRSQAAATNPDERSGGPDSAARRSGATCSPICATILKSCAPAGPIAPDKLDTDDCPCASRRPGSPISGADEVRRGPLLECVATRVEAATSPFDAGGRVRDLKQEKGASIPMRID